MELEIKDMDEIPPLKAGEVIVIEKEVYNEIQIPTLEELAEMCGCDVSKIRDPYGIAGTTQGFTEHCVISIQDSEDNQ